MFSEVSRKKTHEDALYETRQLIYHNIKVNEQLGRLISKLVRRLTLPLKLHTKKYVVHPKSK